MYKTPKVIQRKTHYVCRCCKQAFAVIVALHRPVARQTWNRDKGTYSIHGYNSYVSKILYCKKCGSVDLRGRKYSQWLRKASKSYPYYTNAFHRPTAYAIRKALNDSNNFKEAKEFEQEKEAKRNSVISIEGKEDIPAEVRKSLDADY